MDEFKHYRFVIALTILDVDLQVLERAAIRQQDYHYRELHDY
ncbi:MAG TPA: hypothetical protein VHK27_02530 [Gammaproteobacteria bacterium]|nr:hypothetical protein [Gammaproteobacteria bacterium]